MLRLAILLFSFLVLPASALAQNYQSLIDHPVRVCETATEANDPPDFAQGKCQDALFYQADPQGRMLWIELEFEARPDLLQMDEPLGLFLSAKASTQAVLNGVAIGSNGKPGASNLREEAGDMDAVFFVPEGTLKTGRNRLLLRMSSMNGEITLNSPIHNLVLAPYRDPRQPGPATWFALITFGLFVASFVYFGVRSIRGNEREGSALIALLSLMAALQLAVEATRQIMPYPYPLHDLRLSLILTFAIGLGLSFAGYVLHVLFEPHRKRRVLALGALLAVMILISGFVRGFDMKTVFVFVAASLSVTLGGVIAYLQGNRSGGWFALAGISLAASILLLGGFFLDTALFLLVATGLLWLLFKQAHREDDGGPPRPETEELKKIELSSNGHVEYVNSSDIIRFCGAGDYVEVFLSGGRSALHSASLASLEQDLSNSFVRVHRSHIVNRERVKSLTRDSAGTGQLQMADGSHVPVSRRNLARVRSVLREG